MTKLPITRNFVMIATAIILLVFLEVSLRSGKTLKWNSAPMGDIERRYLIDRPNSKTNDPLSVLLVLHGFGSNPFAARHQYEFDEVKKRDDFIFVFPEGTGQNAKELGWNGGFCCRSAMYRNIDDIGFLDRIVEKLKAEMDIDRNKIFVAGFSNGALLAYRWGAARSQTVAGIAAVSGSIGGKAGFSAPQVRIAQPEEPVSLLIAHGERDPFFPYEGGVSQALMTKTPGRSSASVAESTQFWRQTDGCADADESSKHGVVLRRYSHCRNGTAVESFLFLKTGHEWPKRLQNLDDKPLFAEYLLDFFRRHPKSSNSY